MANKSKKNKNSNLENFLQIRNFKSIKKINIEISRINIFIGRPNSGKSNLLEALTLFNPIQTMKQREIEGNHLRYDTLDNIFYDRDLSNDIEINLNKNKAIVSYYGGINTFFHLINPIPEFLNAKKNYFKEGLSINEIASKAIMPNPPFPGRYGSKYSLYNFDGNSISSADNVRSENPIRRYEFKDGNKYDNNFSGYLKSSGDNLFAITQNYSLIREWIRSFFKEFKLEILMDYASKKFEIQKKQRGISYKIPFELTPDTFRRMLFHVAAILSNSGCTILLEEPESHSFPPYINELSNYIKSDKNNTYFITTHSPYFFNNMIEDASNYKDISFFHVFYKNYQTHIRKLTDKELKNIWGNGVDVFFNIDSYKQ